MKIKTKLTLWVSFLFFLIILLITVGVRYTNRLADDSANILAANYNTIDYARKMLVALDQIPVTDSAIQFFQENLTKQQNNITESGEQELTAQLRADFEKLKSNSQDSVIYVRLRSDLAGIMLLNMQAIRRKSDLAQETARTATIVISITGAVCFLLAFSLLLNLPANIGNPIRELTDSVRAIAANNYAHRVHFDQPNEFGDLAQSFNTMAEKLAEYNNSNLAKMMQEKRRIETLINNMQDPVIGLDENRNIIFINDEALKISGLQHDKLIGRSANDIAAQNDLIRSLIQDLWKPAATEKQKQVPLKIYADQKESYFEKEIIPISIIPTAEHLSKHIGDVIILRNITPFKELDEARTHFIATVSHEIKTPISSILLSIELLENEKVGPINVEQKQLIHSVKEDSLRLLKITGELLNMTQVETGKIQWRVQTSPVSEIVNYAIDAVKTQAEQRHITLELNCPPDIPSVRSDAEKTAWVLTNLLSNAIHYSHENGIVQLTMQEDDDKVRFEVRDFGKGIDPQYQEKIFDRYFQVPGSSKSGTGLGLAISKEFIEAQGGTISMQSELGTGSVFSFTLLKSTNEVPA
jgi:two-component system, NtrC family, sensor histidine kinase KinB